MKFLENFVVENMILGSLGSVSLIYTLVKVFKIIKDQMVIYYSLDHRIPAWFND